MGTDKSNEEQFQELLISFSLGYFDLLKNKPCPRCGGRLAYFIEFETPEIAGDYYRALVCYKRNIWAHRIRLGHKPGISLYCRDECAERLLHLRHWEINDDMPPPEFDALKFNDGLYDKEWLAKRNKKKKWQSVKAALAYYGLGAVIAIIILGLAIEKGGGGPPGRPPNFWLMLTWGLILLFVDVAIWVKRIQTERPGKPLLHTVIYGAGIFLCVIAITGLFYPEKGTLEWQWVKSILTPRWLK